MVHTICRLTESRRNILFVPLTGRPFPSILHGGADGRYSGSRGGFCGIPGVVVPFVRLVTPFSCALFPGEVSIFMETPTFPRVNTQVLGFEKGLSSIGTGSPTPTSRH